MGRGLIRSPRRIVGPKRTTTWFGFEAVGTTMTAEGGTLQFTLNAAALALRPFTIVRSHFMLALRSDQAAAIEEQTIAFGIAVVSDQAAAVGVSAIPTPITEAASDLWFVHQWMFADESNLTDRTRSGTFLAVDSKAMRKCDIGQDIVVVSEMDTGTGGGVVLRVAGRMLVKNN